MFKKIPSTTKDFSFDHHDGQLTTVPLVAC